jgi:hypothetical protein
VILAPQPGTRSPLGQVQPASPDSVDPDMGILRYVVQGIGWRLGREIAEETIDEVRARTDADAPAPSEAELRRQRRRDERAREKADKARAKDAHRRARDLERELDALKRKIESEDR